jgi:hypothetical protein
MKVLMNGGFEAPGCIRVAANSQGFGIISRMDFFGGK